MAHCGRSLRESLFYSIKVKHPQHLLYCCCRRMLVVFCGLQSKENDSGYIKAALLPHRYAVARAGTIAQRSKNTLSSSIETSTPTVKNIEIYLKEKNVKFSHGHTTIIADCPFCAVGSAKKNKGTEDESRSRTLFVNKTTGSHVCNSCGTSGTWNQFKVRFFMGDVGYDILQKGVYNEVLTMNG